MVKNPPANTGDLGSIPGLERSLGEGNGNPFQYSCLENLMVRGAWRAAVHGVAKSWTRLCDSTTTPALRGEPASLSPPPPHPLQSPETVGFGSKQALPGVSLQTGCFHTEPFRERLACASFARGCLLPAEQQVSAAAAA